MPSGVEAAIVEVFGDANRSTSVSRTSVDRLIASAILLFFGISSQVLASDRYVLSYKSQFSGHSEYCVVALGLRILTDKILLNSEGQTCNFGTVRNRPADRENGQIFRVNETYSESVSCSQAAGSSLIQCSNGAKSDAGIVSDTPINTVTDYTYSSRLNGRNLSLDLKTKMFGHTNTLKIKFKLNDCSGFSLSMIGSAQVRLTPISCKIVGG